MTLDVRAEQTMRWRNKPQVMVRELFGVTPDPWQDKVLEMFPLRPRLAMKASKGPGKLQPKSMILDTPTGSRRWGELKVGETVFAPDGSVTKIVQTFDNGVVPLYRVTFDDGASTLCGGEHLWKVRGAAERMRKHATPYRRETQTSEIWSVLTTEEILGRGVRVKNGKWEGRQFEIPRHEAVQYPAAEHVLDAYVLGVWLGDGDARGGRYTGIDHEVQSEIVARGYRIGAEDKIGQTRSILGLAAQLRPLGLIGLGSHERFVPQSYRMASVRQRQDVLCGLMDTDGCIGTDGHMEFDSTSRQLAEDVVWLVRSLGGVAFFKQSVKKPWYYGKDRERILGKDCYRVTVRTRDCPFKIKRKADRWRPAASKSSTRYLTRYIDRIDPAPSEDSMCIQVDHPSACYLANDFIVTHNTCVEAWCAWNFLLTRPHPNIAAASISYDNLRDGLWKEMAKWRQKAPLLQELFEWQTERIFYKKHPATWFISARSWSKTSNQEQLGNTLAGLHSDYIMFIVDESGSIPTAITMSAEAALSSCIEGHILQAGNTNTLDGALYEACVRRKHLWEVITINGDPDDPLRSSRIDIEWARELIRDRGREDPFVKLLVLGEWPAASINALIGPDEVEAAMKRHYQQRDIDFAPRIFGVDTADEGDDASVIFPRQGLVAFPPIVMRGVSGEFGAGQISRMSENWPPDAIFIDNTGGYGGTWRAALKALNRTAIPVGFAGEPNDRQYANKRAEIYFEAVKWIRDGGALPNVPEMVAELTQTTYTIQKDRLLLEPKKAGESQDRPLA